MIFYNETFVDYKQGKGQDDTIEGQVYREIEELRSQYFGKDKKGLVQLRYPNGVMKKNKSGLYEPKKPFFLQVRSTDGMWRWNDRMQGKYKQSNRFKISDPWIFSEDQIDLVWFLKNHCPEVKARMVHFEDPEEVAKKAAETKFSDIDLNFILYSKKSPISTDTNALRSVAEVFGVKDANTMGIWELRKAVYDEVSLGEKTKNKYVNIAKLEELTDNDSKMRAAQIVRKHINMGVLRFKSSDNTWYIHDGEEWGTPLLKINVVDRPNKEHVLLNEMLEKSSFKGKVYAELGIDMYETKADVKELGRPALISLCSQEGIEYDKKETLDDLVEKYCKHKGIKS